MLTLRCVCGRLSKLGDEDSRRAPFIPLWTADDISLIPDYVFDRRGRRPHVGPTTTTAEEKFWHFKQQTAANLNSQDQEFMS